LTVHVHCASNASWVDPGYGKDSRDRRVGEFYCARRVISHPACDEAKCVRCGRIFISRQHNAADAAIGGYKLRNSLGFVTIKFMTRLIMCSHY